MLLAGEASGDAYAAELIARLRTATAKPLDFAAVCGARTAALGVKTVADSSDWGAMSIVQSLAVAPRVIRGALRAKATILSGTPGLLIPIDFGYVNVKLARISRGVGWKVLYFVPPGSWRRDRQGANIPEVSDAVVTPFQWSAEMLNRMGANAHFFGHPLKQIVQESLPAQRPIRDGIAVLPGSRNHEIDENLSAIAGALNKLPNLRAEFAVAPSVDPDRLRRRWEELAPSRKLDAFTCNDRFGVLSRARAAIVCSGTATLEAALCGCPMVVVYRVSRVMEFEATLLKLRPKFAALPNILLDRFAVPELMQHDANPQRIAYELGAVIDESSERSAQLAAFAELDLLLGPPNALDQTVDLALRMIAEIEAVKE